ncbi:ExbD/TolR family protein [Gemmobacter lutimaris]|nr:ExbD/TolR family protein [Gemmobacter lutimaris]
MIRLPDDSEGQEGFVPLAEINVTPMVDVMLVLLIIFMVATPLMVAGVRVDLPKSASAAPLDRDKPVVVNVLPDGGLLLDSQQVPPGGLIAAVTAALAGVPGRPVYVAGDKGAAYGRVIEVIDSLAQGGIARVVLVADRDAAAWADQTAHDHAGHD